MAPTGRLEQNGKKDGKLAPIANQASEIPGTESRLANGTSQTSLRLELERSCSHVQIGSNKVKEGYHTNGAIGREPLGLEIQECYDCGLRVCSDCIASLPLSIDADTEVSLSSLTESP
ncbi:unnamed protein product [Protopolystoma xenopodis]|uniref:Uncharacterized protein n=1 Tax=Protopolystoma xenopodis TaxID=117903 RepID=A0A3S5A5H8_9PLAT|nr:unnamed protein product [Protopolystoma xenopodis]